MKGRIWTVAAGLTSARLHIAVPAALTAYTSAKLEVRQSGATSTIRSRSTQTTIDASGADLRSTGTQLTTNQGRNGAPAGEGDREGARPRGHRPSLEGSVQRRARSLRHNRPNALEQHLRSRPGSWSAPPGRRCPCPYLIATTGAQTALGPAYVQVCLPPPDIPPGTPGQATFGRSCTAPNLRSTASSARFRLGRGSRSGRPQRAWER
jgi:hypothetical protein